MNKRQIVMASAVSAMLAAGSLTVVGATALAAPAAPRVIKACAMAKTGAMRVVPVTTSKCKRGERLLAWNVAGARGATGTTGAAGAPGPRGDTGATGPSAPGAKGDPGATGPSGGQGLKGDIGVQGPIGPAGPQGPTGAQWSSAVLDVTLAADDAWHDLARFQLETGTWDMGYWALLYPADGSDAWSTALSGTVDCRTTLGGVTAPITQRDGGTRFGFSVNNQADSVTSSELVISCRNSVVRDGTDPVTISGQLSLGQDTPHLRLAAEVL